MSAAITAQVVPHGEVAELITRERLAAEPRASSLQAPLAPVMSAPSRTDAHRWSGDAWVLLREDTTTPVTSGRGSYGQSQVGGVLRYRLTPHSGHRLTAYARASAALVKESDREVAAGLSARLIPAIPVVLAAEVRASDLHTRTVTRSAVFAYTELPPMELPLESRIEGYAQGGYVTGAYATGFIDGQVRVDRRLAGVGAFALRAGGGTWGGMQEGAKRLDVGPGATVTGNFGRAQMRMSADWRFRVAGSAHPRSGPALTIAAGF